MPDELVTVRSFPSRVEAEIATAALADAGIKAMIFEESLSNIVGGHLDWAALQVKVLDHDLERAREVLAREPWDEVIDWSEADRLAREGGSAPAEPEVPSTDITNVARDRHPAICSESTPAEHDADTMPDSRPETDISATPLRRPTSTRSYDSELADREGDRGNRSAGDEISRSWADRMTERAYRAALLGFLFLPFVHIYALGLLLWIGFSGETTSRNMSWKYYTALLISVLVTFFFSGSVLGLLALWN